MANSPYLTGQELMPIVPSQFNLTPEVMATGAQDAFIRASQGSPDPMTHLINYVLGAGALKVGDDTGTFVLNPGGSFEISSPKGFSVTGNPGMRFANITIPVNFRGNRGTVGLEGNWGFNPAIQAKFSFGNKNPSLSSPEQSVNQAVAPYEQQYNSNTYDKRAITPQDLLNQTIDAYRSSGGRDPNSPTTWLR